MAKGSKEEVRIMKGETRVRAKWSEESRVGDTSFRVLYYGATEAAVPFMWESQPGTPKHPIFDKNDKIAPPLTPPPSYTHTTFSPCPSPVRPSTPAPSRRKPRKPGFFSAFFASISRKTNRHVSNAMSLHTSNSGPLTWSTSSSSSSSVASPPRHRPGRSNTAGYPSKVKFRSQNPLFNDDIEEQEAGSPVKEVICFGYNKDEYYSMLNARNHVVSIKGH